MGTVALTGPATLGCTCDACSAGLGDFGGLVVPCGVVATLVRLGVVFFTDTGLAVGLDFGVERPASAAACCARFFFAASALASNTAFFRCSSCDNRERCERMDWGWSRLGLAFVRTC